jgi:hypothetical protein
MRESYYLLTGMWQHYLHIVGFWYDKFGAYFEKGNNKEDHFDYLHIVERDSASLENLSLGLERLSLRRNKRLIEEKAWRKKILCQIVIL